MNEPTIFEARIREVTFGKNVKIVKPVNLYECTIGDDCFIGPFVEIQKGAVIGKNCKIQSHSFICELVTIGDNCFISHGAMFINDTFSKGKPAGGNQYLWKPTVIGNDVAIGTNATILPVRICNHVVIGAGAVVTKDINKPGFYVGNPAKLLKEMGEVKEDA
jgi:acetyltransferase-like isoleucine patch superfamily enzyme